jgi:glycine cleavage system H lipoate-binding protein
MSTRTKESSAAGRQRKGRQIKGFQVLENECIWMKAGVINYRMCDHAYDCYHCPFDTAMRKAMGIEDGEDSKKIAPRWVEFLQEKYHGSQRPCRHALTGRIDAPKICPLNYECYHCAYDQMLDEMDLAKDPEAPVTHRVAGYRMAEGYYYHMGHNWLRFEHGGRVRIGLDDFAVRLFGSPEKIELPPLGENLQQHKVGWTFSRAGHQAAVLSPASGTVLVVNQNVKNHPDIVHLDPYHQGWLMLLEPNFPKRDLKGLYYADESDKWMELEVEKLLQMVGADYEQLAATGAEPVADVFGTQPGMDWDVLSRTFLKTERIS